MIPSRPEQDTKADLMNSLHEAKALGSADHMAPLLASALLRKILLSKPSTRGFDRAWVAGSVYDSPSARKCLCLSDPDDRMVCFWSAIVGFESAWYSMSMGLKEIPDPPTIEQRLGKCRPSSFHDCQQVKVEKNH